MAGTYPAEPRDRKEPPNAIGAAMPSSSLGPEPLRARRPEIILGFTAIYLIWGSTYLGIRYAVETIPHC